MQKGDGLILAVIAASLLLLAADTLSAGGVSSWAQQTLPTLALTAGHWGYQIGHALLVLALAPLLAGVIGRFTGLPNILANALTGYVRLADAISEQLGGAARWFALGLVLATVTIVIQRYVFGFASTKLAESVIYMHALLFLLSSASTALHDGHVRVDIIYAKLTERGRAWTELLGTYLCLVPMSVLIIWSARGYLSSSWRILERSRESDGLAFVYLLKTAIVVFAITLILQGVSLACRAALTLSGRAAPDLPGQTDKAEV
ncbi:TRAP transporter small permease subunit [Maricaulis sp. D1M11]|uniref:TRAP transporter small permease subunit n=1 Tax=Maricaulis sp. D1M11 TaxID=3076117 RepID=UPI0039B3DB54